MSEDAEALPPPWRRVLAVVKRLEARLGLGDEDRKGEGGRDR